MSEPSRRRRALHLVPYLIVGMITGWILSWATGPGPIGGGTGELPKPASVSVAPESPTLPATPPAATPVPDPEPLEDDGWFMEAYELGPDIAGGFSGTARVVNLTGQPVESASFTVTVLDGSQVVAALRGSTGPVSIGETVTVSLLSADPFVARKAEHVVELQYDGSY